MVVRTLVKPRTYRDSVQLMNISASAQALPGVEQAFALMGTERNKAALEASGLSIPELATARPDDLVVVVRGDDARTVEAALAHLDGLLATEPTAGGGERAADAPRSVDTAVRRLPGANVAIISVPGIYAAAEAAKALRRGLHVMLFSDNVSLEDELRLKRLASEKGLLLMGPDCGTAIINGVPLGFANAVARGPIGIVGAAGTGIQQASVIIDRMGSGISHAIGTGGRDLSDGVGGVTMLMGIDTLEEDPDTRVILLLSKPPGARTAERILERVRRCTKPVVVAFLGSDGQSMLHEDIITAGTLEEAAARTVAVSRGEPWREVHTAFPREAHRSVIEAQVDRKQPGQRYLRGLYCGGTLADEALHLLEKDLGAVHSNVPLRPELKLPDTSRSIGHTVVDFGDDEFTRGRPHPMIDPSYRAARLIAEFRDPEVAVVLCDVILGYGSHPDPAGALADAIRKARATSGRDVTVVASVCGTMADPQGLERQEAILRQEGVLVFPTNAYATEVAGTIARRCAEREGLA